MFKIVKRLFEPATMNKLASLKLIIESSVSTIWFDIVPLFTIPFAINLIQENKTEEFVEFCYAVFLVYLVLWIANLFIRKWDFYGKYAYAIWIEETYRKKIILKDNLSMDVLGTGKVQSLVQKGITDWVEALWQILYQIPKVLLSIVSGVIIMRNFGFTFLILFFIYMFFSTVGFTYYRKIRLKYDKKVNEIEDEKNAHSVRVIMSRQEIIFSGKETAESKQLAGYSNKQLDVVKDSAAYDFVSDWFISGIGTILPFLGVIYIIKMGMISSVDIGLLISFIYFSSRFAFNMYSMLWIVRQTLEFLPKIERFWNFLDFVPELRNYNSGEIFIHGDGSIEFVNVGFEYNQDFLKNKFFDKEENKEKEESNSELSNNIILQKFNLKIQGGTKIALVGKSGSGKTTIAKLIVGYLKASSGKVLVDGQDLKNISLKSFYKHVGYLTQDPGVFDGSIKENMLYARAATDKEIIEALNKAGCDFVFKMKKGIQTQIGEKGIRLSGGERQRLAIAKLFLKNPEIIILDEPTSALDSFSEEKITQSLEELFKGRTTIIIAHRLQTVKRADRILVIENGQIVEDGNHESLVPQNGVYAKLLAMQSGF